MRTRYNNGKFYLTTDTTSMKLGQNVPLESVAKILRFEVERKHVSKNRESS